MKRYSSYVNKTLHVREPAMNGMKRDKTKEELDTPCLLIDLDILERNIKQMANSVQTNLRPHIKTHKCPILAKKQLEAGAIGITCAKIGEAEIMVKAGINDILIANQIVGKRKIARLLDLASETFVRVIVDNPTNVKELATAAKARQMELHILVELDVGQHRCGVQPGEPTLELARKVVESSGLVFDGLEFYEGHVSKISDPDERKCETERNLELAIQMKELIEKSGIPVEIVSSGGTCTYAITGRYPGITEIRPGSYIFMDTKYHRIMPDFDYALIILATVVSTPRTNGAVIDAGSKSMTQDNGIPTILHPEGWRLAWMNEEHGVLERIDGPPLSLGDKVEIIPSHSCTTVNLYNQFWVIQKGTLKAVWDISARGKLQ